MGKVTFSRFEAGAIFEDKALDAITGLKLPEDEHQWVLILGSNS